MVYIAVDYVLAYFNISKCALEPSRRKLSFNVSQPASFWVGLAKIDFTRYPQSPSFTSADYLTWLCAIDKL